MRCQRSGRALRKTFEGKKLYEGRGLARQAARMDDADLFDVFSIDNNPEPPQKTIPGEAAHLQQKAKKTRSKRKHEARKDDSVLEEAISPTNGSKAKRSHDDVVGISSDDNENGGPPEEFPRSAKKSRKAEANPIVLDSFEKESDQIVRATQGLQGAPVTDEDIVIKKRVPKAPT